MAKRIATIAMVAITTLIANSNALAGTYNHGEINGGVTFDHTENGDIHIQGKIDGWSTVTLNATGGSIVIDGKSTVTLTASGPISIGLVGSRGDRKIDGNSTVHVTAGTGIELGGKIDGGSHVWFKTGTGSIHVYDKIDGRSQVIYWPPGSFVHNGKVDGASTVTAQNW